MNQERIETCVERLCDKGCRSVWLDIQRLESGDILPEVETLTSDERRVVLQELKDIMAVYGEEGCSLVTDT